MMLLYGLAAFGLLWWLSKVFVRSDTKAVARAIKIVGGVLALGAAVAAGHEGPYRHGVAARRASAPGRSDGAASNCRCPGAKQGGERVSRVPVGDDRNGDRSTVRRGLRRTCSRAHHAGRRLGDLDQASLRALYAECRSLDPEGAAFLEAYFDRRFPGWREYAQGNRDTRTRTQTGAMSKEEAYQVLGLQPGASLDEIREAYRRLMKKLHPDQGGTAHLAARVNQAREVLLSRHR